jgi:hypothetical protein
MLYFIEFYLLNHTGGIGSNVGDGVEDLVEVNKPVSLFLIT